MRILLVEDEPHAARMLAKGLREQTYAVDVALDGRKVLELVSISDYDAVILDVMLPFVDGLEVCQRLRSMGSQVPVLMLTARDSIDARIAGLDSGADDYLTKPFDVGELYARLRALIRRGVRPPVPVRMTAGPLEIDTRSHSVTCRGQLVSLAKREYALLEYLVRRAGEVVGRAEISEHVWDGSYDPMSNVIDVFIQRLRRKIDRPGDDSIIQTRRGEGYLLTSDSPDHAPAR
jgi:two-component system, OmpR family, copper resistance phosphate regulon response regulator CusR